MNQSGIIDLQNKADQLQLVASAFMDNFCSMLGMAYMKSGLPSTLGKIPAGEVSQINQAVDQSGFFLGYFGVFNAKGGRFSLVSDRRMFYRDGLMEALEAIANWEADSMILAGHSLVAQATAGDKALAVTPGLRYYVDVRKAEMARYWISLIDLASVHGGGGVRFLEQIKLDEPFTPFKPSSNRDLDIQALKRQLESEMTSTVQLQICSPPPDVVRH